MAGADFCLKKAIEERANSWILDYAYYCTWEEFCSTKNIDIKTTRDFVQWIVQQPYISTSDRKLKVQIMLFMCRLSDGSDHTTRYALSSDLTALEESLRNIDLMESILGKDHADTINALRISIKKQAVLVCCRADDFDAGKKIFQRQWKNMSFSTKNDERIVDHLETVLESYDKDQSYIKFSTYERFLKSALECLSIINKAFTAPYLLQKAETFEKRRYFDKEKAESRISLTVMDEWAKTKNMKARTPKAKQNEDLKLKKIRQIKERKEYSSDDTETEDNYSKCCTKKRKIASSTPKRMSRETDRNNCNKEEIDDSDGPETEDNDAVSKKRKIASSTPKKMSRETDKNNCNKEHIDETEDEGLSPIHRHLQMTNKTLRKPWSRDETIEFYKAVQKFGEGDWSNIKSQMKTVRTNVQLRDRWRNMTKDKDLMNNIKRKLKEDEGLSPIHRHLQMTNKTLRKPWSRDETIEFYKAVQKFGEGDWSNIKIQMKTVRTNVQLKDRWRNMTKDKDLMKNIKRKLKSE